MSKQLVANITQNTLGDICHDSGVNQCCQSTCQIDTSHTNQCMEQWPKVWICGLQERSDITVNQGSQEQGCDDTGNGTCQNADQNQQHLEFIILPDISHQTL